MSASHRPSRIPLKPPVSPPPPVAIEDGSGVAPLLVGAGILAFVAAIAATCLTSTGCLTPAQLAADGPAIEAGMAEGCPLLNAIPVAGVFLADACQGEERAVADAVSKAAAEVADAGAPVVAAKRPLYRTRHGKRRVVGYAPAHLCDAAQRHLDAMADAGAPPPDAGPATVALPPPPAVLPVVDAGREGGR